MKNNKVKDYRSKKKLNENERVLIEHYYTKKKIKNYSYIAKEIGRDRKTIEREIKRNRYSNVWGHWIYKADVAQKRTYKRRIKANRKHTKLFTREGKKFVERIKEAMKKEGWSISASRRYEYEKKKKTKIAISTMYRYARKYDKELEKMLLYKSWGYRKGEYNYGKNSKLLKLESIETREEVINNRERKGDYEVDLIVSKKSKSVILNIIDRKSRNILTKKLANKEKLVVKEAISNLLKGKEIYSITTDNGTEFTDLIDICKELGIKGYRCHSYSSWEKGSVEVHNRYIRRYIPKGADINDYTDEYIENITKKINRLPRKIHGYRTPEEIFNEKTIKYF